MLTNLQLFLIAVLLFYIAFGIFGIIAEKFPKIGDFFIPMDDDDEDDLES